MRIVFISGLWPTKDENGFFELGDRIIELLHDCSISFRHHDDVINSEYDVVIAHSFGANVAEKIPCKYLAMIEPVRYYWKQNEWEPNSLKADCFLRKDWKFFPSVGIKGQPSIKIPWLSHGNAPRNELIRATILSALRAI